MRTLYLECASGISGDMTVGALLDLGADQEKLLAALATLPIDGYQVRISRVRKSGLDVCDFAVLLDDVHENHDHDMEYLHGHGCPDQEQPCHAHAEHPHCHSHRALPEILAILDGSGLTARAKALAKRIFTLLAEAEAKAHGTAPDEVHFHEVGAVDSIMDIAAAAVCLDDLDVTEAIVPAVQEGRGFVRCQHGLIPVPVPATLNLLASAGIPLRILPVEGELATPTGAAIAAAIRTSGTLPERFRVLRVGYGAGKRSYSVPGFLRILEIASETDT